MPTGAKPIEENVLLPPRVRTSVLDAKPEAFLDQAPMHATLTTNKRLTAADHFQDVRLIELDLDEGVGLPAYKAGDVVCLMPENAPEKVDQLIQRLEWTKEADMRLSLTDTDPCK